ncbi:MAG: hypothetical protein H6612_05575 [Ignavibacteriales bacterium]|nr:hypothetical protein [Ignavibacteriales bacterium]MCB9258808.1 hypothetical protein [Ignavibacteriales bacterium]
MKKILAIIILFSSFIKIVSQDNTQIKIIEGKVQYISSQFVYVQFENTNGINKGDTLFVKNRGKYIPSLIIESLSSSSCAAKEIKLKPAIDESIFTFIKIKPQITTKDESKLNSQIQTSNEIVKIDTTEFIGFKKLERNIYGKFSVSGYSNISNTGEENTQNWRYSFSINADNINDSKISLSNYTTFRYRADEWNSVSSNISDALKVYELALKYDFNQNTNILLGRKINRKVANIGAVDGLQAETKMNKFILGGIVGSRPNFTDYGFNSKLLEFGAYVNRSDSIGNGAMQNTISLFQQMNDLTTDRRFLYFQHTNNIVANTSLFLSTELDLYEKINEVKSNSLRFTSLYVSLRYSPLRWLSTSISYDARKNVIYYETFKNYADRLAEDALRQGFKIRFNLRPIKYVFASIYSGYRFRESDPKPTTNFGGSLTHSRIPYLNVSANVSYINLATNYLDGNIWGLRFTKDLLDGNLSSSLGYRNVNYNFSASESSLIQNIFQLELSYRFFKNMFLSIDFEGTYQNSISYSNIYFNFTTRF